MSHPLFGQFVGCVSNAPFRPFRQNSRYRSTITFSLRYGGDIPNTSRFTIPGAFKSERTLLLMLQHKSKHTQDFKVAVRRVRF